MARLSMLVLLSGLLVAGGCHMQPKTHPEVDRCNDEVEESYPPDDPRDTSDNKPLSLAWAACMEGEGWTCSSEKPYGCTTKGHTAISPFG